MSVALQSQRIIDVAEAGAVAVSDEINHVVGVTPTKLIRPAAAQMLVLSAEAGNWRLRIGDKVAAMTGMTATPAASVSDGSGSLLLAVSKSLVLPAPAEITVKGFNATDILTYYWL